MTQRTVTVDADLYDYVSARAGALSKTVEVLTDAIGYLEAGGCDAQQLQALRMHVDHLPMLGVTLDE